MQAIGHINSTMINHREADVRLANGRGLAALGGFALALGIVALVRLTQKTQRRKEMRDNAVATLRESGEHFLPPLEAEPLSPSSTPEGSISR